MLNHPRLKSFGLLPAAAVAVTALLTGCTPAPIVKPGHPDLESPLRTDPVDLLVIHTAESAEYATADQDICRFLAERVDASVHWCVDADSMTPGAPEDRIGWTAGSWRANNRALQIEIAGRAGQGSRGWADAYSQKALRNAAWLVGHWSKDHNVPLVKISPNQVAAGQRGVIGHIDVTMAYNVEGGHWDPGPAFPWPQFMDMARSEAVKYTPPAPPTTTTSR